MRIPRIYQDQPLALDSSIELDTEAASHIGRVLRMSQGEQLSLFNGDGHDYLANIDSANKRHVLVTIISVIPNNSESPLNIHLGQVISRGDRMDFTIQKSVELGVTTITPLFSERCGVKLSSERLAKKVQQWQKIVISACEQSGRSIVPKVRAPMDFSLWSEEPSEAVKLTLHPRASHGIGELTLAQPHVRLLIGPEGGLTDAEIAKTEQDGFTDLLLGPRVLRTETAALSAISALQLKFGDL